MPPPLIVQRYLEAANKIDVANQSRQGLLAIKRAWATQSWKCFIFQTLLRMMLCHGFLAYHSFEKDDMPLEFYTVQVYNGLIERVK
jgi:hypothetical protein